jgi:antitoxin component of RelBE/YafQ-DinJ toxin-antitoxin module
MKLNPDFSLSARIPMELAEQAKQIAKQEGLNMSSLIRQSLINQIKAYSDSRRRGAHV